MSSPLLVATSIGTALAMGLAPVLFRSLQAQLQTRLGLPARRLDQLNKLALLSWLPLMPLAGWLVDHWGLREVLFTGSLVLGLAVSWLALAQSLTGVLWGLLGLSLAGACLTTAGVTLMPLALTLFPRGSLGAALCLGYVFVGLASLLTPACLPWVVGLGGYRRTVLALGFLCLAPAALAALAKAEIPSAAPIMEAPLQDGKFWLIALVAFLYVPLEQSLEIWPSAYLTEIGYGAWSIVRLHLGFWCAFLLARLGVSWLTRSGNEDWFALLLLAISSMVLGNLASAYAPSSGYVGFWLVGACYGPLFPLLLSTLDVAEPRRISGEAVGLVFALTSLSSLIACPLLASFSKRKGPRECMRVPMLLGLLMAAPALVIALMRHGK